MQAKNQLLSLLRIQELALEIGNAEKVLIEAPGRLEQIEEQFRERNAEYVAVKDRNDALDADQRTRTGELEDLEEKHKKFMEDLMQVKNQREYAAILKEIDSVKAQIAEHNEVIFKDTVEMEKLAEELKSHEEHITTERAQVEQERAEVEKLVADARATIDTLTAERQSIASDLPQNLRETIKQLEATRQGIFLSKADEGSCASCFVRVRPQVFQEIRMAAKVHRCSNCRRFLYHEPSLRPNPTPASGDGVEVINDGAV